MLQTNRNQQIEAAQKEKQTLDTSNQNHINQTCKCKNDFSGFHMYLCPYYILL